MISLYVRSLNGCKTGKMSNEITHAMHITMSQEQ